MRVVKFHARLDSINPIGCCAKSAEWGENLNWNLKSRRLVRYLCLGKTDCASILGTLKHDNGFAMYSKSCSRRRRRRRRRGFSCAGDLLLIYFFSFDFFVGQLLHATDLTPFVSYRRRRRLAVATSRHTTATFITFLCELDHYPPARFQKDWCNCFTSIDGLLDVHLPPKNLFNRIFSQESFLDWMGNFYKSRKIAI